MAGTDKSQEFIFRPSPAIILCEPQLGENIGTAARAMANFGLWDLRIVNPRDPWPNERAIAAASRADHVIDKVRVFATVEEAIAAASRADHVIDKVRVFATVEEAIADLQLVFATTARRRDMQKPVYGPEEGAQRMISHISGGAKAGLLFGREKWGLYNEEVALADAIVTFPVEAAFASLNIAQAVLLMAYEWRKAGLERETDIPFAGPQIEPAPKEPRGAGYPERKAEVDRLAHPARRETDAGEGSDG